MAWSREKIWQSLHEAETKRDPQKLSDLREAAERSLNHEVTHALNNHGLRFFEDQPQIRF